MCAGKHLNTARSGELKKRCRNGISYGNGRPLWGGAKGAGEARASPSRENRGGGQRSNKPRNGLD